MLYLQLRQRSECFPIRQHSACFPQCSSLLHPMRFQLQRPPYFLPRRWRLQEKVGLRNQRWHCRLHRPIHLRQCLFAAAAACCQSRHQIRLCDEKVSIKCACNSVDSYGEQDVIGLQSLGFLIPAAAPPPPPPPKPPAFPPKPPPVLFAATIGEYNFVVASFSLFCEGEKTLVAYPRCQRHYRQSQQCWCCHHPSCCKRR